MSHQDVPEWLKNKRDDNEPAIVQRIRAWGWQWRACSRHEGHDGWILRNGLFVPAEIKNPAHRWELTKAEDEFMRWCEAGGGECPIFECPDDVDRWMKEQYHGRLSLS